MSVASKLITLRYPGRCSACQAELGPGTTALWDSVAKAVTCQSCSGSPATDDSDESEAAIELGMAGTSALREYERRKVRREERVKKKLGNVLGSVVLAITDDPQSTRAWGRGASGEEKLAQSVARLGREDVIALHDRSVPGSRANIDHVVIAPTGVYVSGLSPSRPTTNCARSANRTRYGSSFVRREESGSNTISQARPSTDATRSNSRVGTSRHDS